jgi:hypothetical protein
MAQSVREELAHDLQAALAGGEGVEGALADVNRRLAAAERRQAQTIEAISIEIKRMSETVDKRLRAVEARNDDAAAAASRRNLGFVLAPVGDDPPDRATLPLAEVRDFDSFALPNHDHTAIPLTRKTSAGTLALTFVLFTALGWLGYWVAAELLVK